MKYPLLLLVLVAAACGVPAATTGDTSPPTSAGAGSGDSITFVMDGGCMMMGPNCPTYELMPGGEFSLRRTGGADIEATGSIDPQVARDLWDVVRSTDFDDLTASLGPGECRACVDGIDTRMIIKSGDTEHVLDSTQVEFDQTVALFALTEEAVAAMSNAAALEIETR
jgi:hypothetical protein